jgi:hypothetical protein
MTSPAICTSDTNVTWRGDRRACYPLVNGTEVTCEYCGATVDPAHPTIAGTGDLGSAEDLALLMLALQRAGRLGEVERLRAATAPELVERATDYLLTELTDRTAARFVDELGGA